MADDSHSPFPIQLEDITSVVEHFSTKYGKFKIGSEIGIIGISAVGHVSLLWSYVDDFNNQVKFVSSIAGPTNLLDEAFND